MGLIRETRRARRFTKTKKQTLQKGSLLSALCVGREALEEDERGN